MTLTLREAISATQTTIDVNGDDTIREGSFRQLASEVVRVRAVKRPTLQPGQSVWQRLSVERGIENSEPVVHAAAVAMTAYSGGGGLPEQWVATVDGQVTANADSTDEAVLTVKAPADSELNGNLVFQVQGETGLPLLDLDPYGNLILQGATVDPSNGGGSLSIKAGVGGAKFYMGFDGTGTPVATFFQSGAIPQPAPIADAADEAEAVTQLNLLLAAMRSLGLIDT